MRCTIVVAVLLGLIATSAVAQDHSVPVKDQLGVGVIVGEPTGLSLKYWLDKEHAIDGAAAWSFWDGNGFQLHADYLWHNFDLLGEPSGLDGKLPIYYGVGARLKFRDDKRKHDDNSDTVFGIRIPVGISCLCDNKPFDLFVEIAPIPDLTPDVELSFSIAVGMRFYVK